MKGGWRTVAHEGELKKKGMAKYSFIPVIKGILKFKLNVFLVLNKSNLTDSMALDIGIEY